MAAARPISGMFVPVPTVFDQDGELDRAVYGELIDYYVSHGADALFLMGPFGQGPAMSPGHRKLALEVAIAAAAGRVPVAPNITAVDLFTSRELAQHAQDHGAACVAMIGPYYYGDRTPDDIVAAHRYHPGSIPVPVSRVKRTIRRPISRSSRKPTMPISTTTATDPFPSS
jgi:dihydrodipicolinate synthase/N-acetylneuraminate lyase